MSLKGKTVGFIGAGNMGEALIKGLVAASVLPGEAMAATDIRRDRVEFLAKQFRIKTPADNGELVRGADVVIEATGSDIALNEAIRSVAYSARVVSLGFYQNNAQGLYLGEEFHHNRIRLVCSQIGGIAPELQHRWDRARLVHTFMDLALKGAVQCRALVTHRVPAAEAAGIYRLLDERPREVLQAVLDFGPAA
jgi:threonine dehydrogenase-like Zn-dependent dehydrogenase